MRSAGFGRLYFAVLLKPQTTVLSLIFQSF
jgi:hypothetical protein